MSTPIERLRAALKQAERSNSEIIYAIAADIRAILPPLPSPICAGHNPDRLTEEQVGVAEGWRLLTEEEQKERVGKRGEFSIEGWIDNKWDDLWCGGPWIGRCGLTTYRTKRPPGYFLPKPKARVPLTADDIPAPICWLRQGSGAPRLVTEIHGDGVYCGFSSWLGFKKLHESEATYSADRREWKPCSKEA